MNRENYTKDATDWLGMITSLSFKGVDKPSDLPVPLIEALCMMSKAIEESHQSSGLTDMFVKGAALGIALADRMRSELDDATVMQWRKTRPTAAQYQGVVDEVFSDEINYSERTLPPELMRIIKTWGHDLKNPSIPILTSLAIRVGAALQRGLDRLEREQGEPHD